MRFDEKYQLFDLNDKEIVIELLKSFELRNGINLS